MRLSDPDADDAVVTAPWDAGRQQGDAEPGPDEAAHCVGIFPLEGDAGGEARRGAQVIGDPAQPVAGLEGHELFLRRLREPDYVPAGEPVPSGNGKVDALLVQRVTHDARVMRQRRDQAEVHVTGTQPAEHLSEAALDEPEPDRWVTGPEFAHHHRHDPGAEGGQEGERHLSAFRADLVGEQPDVAFQFGEGAFGPGQEHLAVAGEPHRAARAGEQRDAEICLQPRDGPGQCGLRYAQQLGGPAHVLFPRDGHELAQPGRQRADGRRRIQGFIHI
jgi:hypothetical protein